MKNEQQATMLINIEIKKSAMNNREKLHYIQWIPVENPAVEYPAEYLVEIVLKHRVSQCNGGWRTFGNTTKARNTMNVTKTTTMNTAYTTNIANTMTKRRPPRTLFEFYRIRLKM